MRFFVYENGGTVEGYVSLSGFEMTGPLKLKGDPVADLEATTRRYVTEQTEYFRTSEVTRDYFDHGRFPSFNGDFNYDSETGTFTLKDTGVISSAYTKVTVRQDGRISGGSVLTYGDIPVLPWSKIDQDLPTTLGGYGITDGVSVYGDSVIGEIKLQGNPISEQEAANVRYLSTLLTDLGSIITGQVVSIVTDTTPEGFLQCNGGQLGKLSYPNLYAMIGDRYSDSFKGAGRPWGNQFGFHDQTDSALGAWETTSPFPESTRNSQILSTKNKVFIMGGLGTTLDPSSGLPLDIYGSDITAGGELGAWTKVGELPETIHSGLSIVIGNRAYIVGGVAGSSNSNRVWSTAIDTDGYPTAWDDMPSLELGTVVGGGFSTDKYIYVFDSETTNIYKGNLEGSGELLSWTLSTSSLPVVLKDYSVVVTTDKVFLIGGVSGGVRLNTVYVAHILPSGELTEWAISPLSLPMAVSSTQVLVTTKDVWVIGGVTGEPGTLSNKTFRSGISVDGSLTGWIEGDSLPEARKDFSLIATSDYVYMLGGMTTVTTDASIRSSLVGGKNDFSPYYDITSPTSIINSFGLPDYQGVEKPVGKLFIKY